MHRIRGIRCGWRLLVLLVLAASGCTGAPVQEMSDARQAMAAAKAAKAPVKAPDDFVKATAHMRYAESALQNGRYKSALEHATWAKKHALDARQRALEPHPDQKKMIRDFGQGRSD